MGPKRLTLLGWALLAAGLVGGVLWAGAVWLAMPSGLDPGESCLLRQSDSNAHVAGITTSWLPPHATCTVASVAPGEDGVIYESEITGAADKRTYDYISPGQSARLMTVFVVLALSTATGLVLLITGFTRRRSGRPERLSGAAERR
jgi:hypothetical protein